MFKVVATLLLISASFGSTVAAADGMPKISHLRGCGFQGRFYTEGQFCSLGCRGNSCDMQVCHNGRWEVERAACQAAFGCAHYC